MPAKSPMEPVRRMRIAIRGLVQGVGFRPFVYRLAHELGLAGWVSNSTSGVRIEAEGREEPLSSFLLRIQTECPPLASIQSLEHLFLDPTGYDAFAIRESAAEGEPSALVLPDISTCAACRTELFDPGDRRYRYPFITCTHCGPRFSIITALPYDRLNTSMAGFAMCPACRREYENPLDRRFHAQPIACPDCGPQLSIAEAQGAPTARGDAALRAAESLIHEGGVLAVKGIGGFQLMVDARNEQAVALLRRRKGREEKPFAVMMPSMEHARAHCLLSPLEERLLTSPESPIVLLERKPEGKTLAPGVAPGNPCLGVMLPYSPLHALIMADLGFPVVATSGNLSDEPICTDDGEARTRLAGIADRFLLHDRPIVRHVDDSIGRIVAGREIILRRARGYAPLPVRLRNTQGRSILGVGAHLKNSVALLRGDNAFLSQHIGDLETGEALLAHRRTSSDLQSLYGEAREAACDLHPDYLSTREARRTMPRVTAVQHHYAHVLSCMAENELEGPLLGVSWDGTGLGTDGTVWGGEFLIPEGSSFRRAASFLPFRLPGGDQAAREPRRTALAILHLLFGEDAWRMQGSPAVSAFPSAELPVLRHMLTAGLHSPWSTSAGRLFDAAASLLGIRQKAAYEGQPAMELEFAASRIPAQPPVLLPVIPNSARDTDIVPPHGRGETNPAFLIDWKPLFRHLVEQYGTGTDPAAAASVFHTTMAEAILAVARKIGHSRVVLTGGCFQNRLLTEMTIGRLRSEGFQVYWHQRVPPNDGGIALGQVAGALAANPKESA